MKQKELTKTYMMLKLKKTFDLHGLYNKYVIAVRVKCYQQVLLRFIQSQWPEWG